MMMKAIIIILLASLRIYLCRKSDRKFCLFSINQSAPLFQPTRPTKYKEAKYGK